jgi:hypothetical protein
MPDWSTSFHLIQTTPPYTNFFRPADGGWTRFHISNLYRPTTRLGCPVLPRAEFVFYIKKKKIFKDWSWNKKLRGWDAHNIYRFIQRDEEAWNPQSVYILTLGLFSLECPTIQVVKKKHYKYKDVLSRKWKLILSSMT